MVAQELWRNGSIMVPLPLIVLTTHDNADTRIDAPISWAGMDRLRDAAVLITGASSGIGQATALAFARRGARLALCARRLDRLEAVARGCRAHGAPQVLTLAVDLARPSEPERFVAAALAGLGRADVLINNAGVGWRGPLLEQPEAVLEELVATNLMAVVRATRAVLPAMLEARRGVIVNVASVVGVRAMPYSAAYSATKHALVGLSHALRGELTGTGVKVTVVYPGTTATEFFQGRPPGGLLLQRPEQVASTIVHAACRPRRDVFVAPYRLAQLVEPLLGGPLDWLLGAVRRRQARREQMRPAG
jgi:short-subunit dehydrogenase